MHPNGSCVVTGQKRIKRLDCSMIWESSIHEILPKKFMIIKINRYLHRLSSCFFFLIDISFFHQKNILRKSNISTLCDDRERNNIHGFFLEKR